MDRIHLSSEQVAKDIRQQILYGEIPPGTKLESLRDMARSRNIAKNTAVRVYELLVEAGLVEPRRGSGFFVTGNGPREARTDTWAPAMDLALQAAGLQRDETEQAGGQLSLGEGLPPSSWLETCRLDRYMQKVGRSGLGTVFRYGDPRGYMPLRKKIALKLRSHGIAADWENILLTQGAYQAVDLVIRHMVRPGESVLVDDPGFYPTFNKIRLQGAQPVGIRRTAHGPDLNMVAEMMNRYRPRLFITQSCGHNPTGGDMTDDTARSLLSLAKLYGVTLVDDDALADFMPLRAPRMAAEDQLEHSILVGSFSKSLSSVVRVGYVACRPALLAELTQVKTVVSLNSSLYAERTVDAVITEGRFQKHVAHLRARSRKAMRSALQVMDRYGVEVFTRPAQGLFLWARIPGVDDSLEFTRRMLAQGIALAPGAIFSTDPQRVSPWIRFNVGFVERSESIHKVLSNNARRKGK